MRTLSAVAILTVAVLISGCETTTAAIRNLMSKADDSCRISYKSTGGWSISGLEIPTTRLAAGTTVKIGKVVYNADEAYQLSSAAQALEQQRLTNCALMNSDAFSRMGDSYKAPIFTKIVELNAGFSTLGQSLAKAETPSQGLDAAAKAIADAEKAKKSAQLSEDMMRFASEAATAVVKPVAEQASKASADAADATALLNSIRPQLAALEADLLILKASPSAKRIDIVGFDTSAVSLPDSARSELAYSFKAALDAVPHARKPSVLIVGYADQRGSYRSNLEIALRRADVVSEFLRRQSFPRPFDAKSVSGGIGGTDAEGRRVEIYVSNIRSELFRT